jgi:hypothetical protein
MPRVRVLLAMLVLPVASIAAAGCARTDPPGAGGPDDTTVTTPPLAGTAPATASPTPTTIRPALGPLLVWPATTSVAVTHPVTVPPVPLLEHLRVGRHPDYDRIVYQFAGPIPNYLIQRGFDPAIVVGGWSLRTATPP